MAETESMTLVQVWGALAIFTVCPLLGGIELKIWIRRTFFREKSAQFPAKVGAHHPKMPILNGLVAGADGLIGAIAILLARYFFPADPTWEIIALMALVFGQYWMAKQLNTMPILAGYVIHDWLTASFVLLLSLISFTIFRRQQTGFTLVLSLIPVMTILRYGDGVRALATALLCGLMVWIHQKTLHRPNSQAQQSGQTSSGGIFHFFRSDRALLHLDLDLETQRVGSKVAILAQLKYWGYPIPMGWIFFPGDDVESLLESLRPSTQAPLMLRAAPRESQPLEPRAELGLVNPNQQHRPIFDITNKSDLASAITLGLISYNRVSSDRRPQNTEESAPVAVMVQQQIQGVFSGIARSRDLMPSSNTHAPNTDAPVKIEAWPGNSIQFRAGSVFPENYRVWVRAIHLESVSSTPQTVSWVLPEGAIAQVQGTQVEGSGRVPIEIIQQVAFLIRHIEARYHRIPQEMTWSYDGKQLWILGVRSVPSD